MSWFEASLRWYALSLLMTLGWAPLVRLLCSRLADRGAFVARPLVLLGVVYPSWLLASLELLPYSTAGLWATLLAGAAVGWFLAWRRGVVERGWLRSLLAAEALFLVAFAGYVWLRGFTPDILNTEKPMDAAFLSSAARTTAMPPPDPWFAGEPINYYYLGYLLHGALARMSGVVSTTAFNLALASTFAMTATAAAGVAFDAARPWLSRRRALVAGAVATALLLLVGNLYAALQLVTSWDETVAADWWRGIGWRSSRIVCDGPRVGSECPALDGRTVETINEFPFFSFLLGDLHPHVMALPFTLVVLALALNAALGWRSDANGRSGTDWAGVAVLGAVAGSLYAMNSWDMPTYLLVGAAAVFVGWRPFGPRRAIAGVAMVIASALLAWAPFVIGFVPPPGGDVRALPAAIRGLPVVPTLLTAVGVHAGERTSVGEFLTIFGVPYLFGVWLIGHGLVRSRASSTSGVGPGLVLALPVLVAALLLPAPVLLLAGVPLAGADALLRRRRDLSPATIGVALVALGLALTFVVELFYIRDLFDSRMNTLFKVYYQVWTLFALGASLAVVALWQAAWPRRLARPVIFAALTVGLAAGAVYPVLASYKWTGEFAEWAGLDGIAYVGTDHPDELAAIRWLQANARPDDVLLEAAGCSYYPISQVPFNRASAYSGVPTVIGWEGHEEQWRPGQPELLRELPRRQADVAEAFADPSGDAIDRYGVTLIYVGRYERDDFSDVCPVAVTSPDVRAPSYPGDGWEVAFSEGDVRIYRRIAAA